MIKCYSMGKEVNTNCFTYPAGEPGFKVYGSRVDQVKIIPDNILGRYDLSVDIITAVQMINRFKDVELCLPYLPMSREDRIMDDDGHVSSFGKDTLLNQLFRGVKRITTYDMHSNTPESNIIDISPKPEIDKTIEDFDPDIIIFPDKGAKGRYDYGLISDCVVGYANKSRTKDGLEIHDTTVIICGGDAVCDFASWTGCIGEGYNDIKVLVIDDICDGGATFIKLAEYLKEQCTTVKLNMALHVSHGIFSKGLDSLLEHYNHIYTTDSFCNFIEHEKLTRYKIFN